MKLIKTLSFEFENISYLNIGNALFLIGIFFLPSALPLGLIFLLTAVIISFCFAKENFFQNRWNLILFICLIWIIFSTIYSTILNPAKSILDFDKSTIWLNLFNWVPIYFFFIGSQIYLKSEKQRLLLQRVLIAGTVPVLVSCIMQKFLNIYGPFETLFGTIVWFNYKFSAEQVSGLFNNPNYLGMWLTLCLPFSMSALKLEKNNILNSIIMYLINILIIYFAFATFSRNAFIGIVLSLLFMVERRKLIFFSISFFISLFIFIYILPDFLNIIPINFSELSDANTFQKFSSLQLSPINPRIAIWSNAIDFISMRPLFGWGPGSFPHVFYENASLEIPLIKYQHTHNLIIELAYNFGIPNAILIVSSVFSILINTFKKINILDKSLTAYSLNKPLLASFSIFLIAHCTDITYYDGKLSIIFSILLAGLKNFLDEDIELK
tara:strand:+ start:118 stop:1431 length:1314 start_codon:yes stop_codon:yes gene_type:complete